MAQEQPPTSALLLPSPHQPPGSIYVQHYDFAPTSPYRPTAEEKASLARPPPVRRLTSAKTLAEEVHANTILEDGKHHDRFSVFFAHNPEWAGANTLIESDVLPEELKRNEEFKAAAGGRFKRKPTDGMLAIRNWSGKQEKSGEKENGSWHAMFFEFPLIVDANEDGCGEAGKLLDLMRDDEQDGTIAVYKSSATVFLTIPSDDLCDAPSSISDDTPPRNVSSFAFIFLHTPTLPKTSAACLNPISFPLSTHFSNHPFASYCRSALTSFFFTSILVHLEHTWTSLLPLLSTHLIQFKAHLLSTPSTSQQAFKIWHTERMLHSLLSWTSALSLGLGAFGGASPSYLTGRLRVYSCYFSPGLSSSAHPSGNSYLPSFSDVFSTHLFSPGTTTISATLLPQCEKNLALLHTLATLRETQLSAEQGASMRRLTWITFIFLPLMLVASVFGMNFQELQSAKLAWFFGVCVGSVVLVLLVWAGFRIWGARGEGGWRREPREMGGGESKGKKKGKRKDERLEC